MPNARKSTKRGSPGGGGGGGGERGKSGKRGLALPEEGDELGTLTVIAPADPGAAGETETVQVEYAREEPEQVVPPAPPADPDPLATFVADVAGDAAGNQQPPAIAQGNVAVNGGAVMDHAGAGTTGMSDTGAANAPEVAAATMPVVQGFTPTGGPASMPGYVPTGAAVPPLPPTSPSSPSCLKLPGKSAGSSAASTPSSAPRPRR